MRLREHTLTRKGSWSSRFSQSWRRCIISPMVMKKSVAILLASFLFAGVLLCTAVSASMQMPMMGTSHAVCSQTTDSSCSAGLDHMEHWQVLLSALPTYFTLLFFAFVLVRTVWWMRRRTLKTVFFELIRPLVFSRAYSYISVHPLQEAFSNGILNAKTY